MKNVSEQELILAFDDLLFFVTLLHYGKYSNYLSKALLAIEHRDRKDVDYLACALAIQADFIWTEDDDFSSQNLVPTKTTTEFLESD
jgi:predicted nucleic acid-binding protein